MNYYTVTFPVTVTVIVKFESDYDYTDAQAFKVAVQEKVWDKLCPDEFDPDEHTLNVEDNGVQVYQMVIKKEAFSVENGYKVFAESYGNDDQ